jgi:hypothetical protein
MQAESNIRPAPITIRKAKRDARDWLYIYLRSNISEREEQDMDGESYVIFEYDEQHLRLPLPDGVEVDVPTDHAENQDALKAALKTLFIDNADFRTSLSDALDEAQLVDWRDRVSEWGGEASVRVDTGQNWAHWVPGESVEVGGQRIYAGTKYQCVQAHTTQGDWPPDVTPALWVVIAETIEWTVGARYEVGDTVMYDGSEYSCLQSHTAQADWQPPNVPALWALVQEPSDEWMPGTWYDIGDVVLYDGSEYQCIQAHTALVGWEPPNVPALWSAL